MNPINRIVEAQIMDALGSNKVLLLYGTRRVGKTFMLNSIVKKCKEKIQLLNGEDIEVQEVFQRRTIANYKNLIGDVKILAIDEAQAIPGIGPALKLMIDSNPELTIIATGSSSLDLVSKSGEPLTGRNVPFFLFPVAQQELNQNLLEVRQDLDERLIYGSYPEIFQLKRNEQKAFYLNQLVNSYLLKDILAYSGIRHSDKIHALLRMIAFQAGSEVSYAELGNQLGLSKITVENYLDLLSKVFILYKLPAYSTNQRSEITKSSKWFFYDNGVRNAIVNDFRIPSMRNDLGALWESYILGERRKKLAYQQSLAQSYFWRNYHQQEIDLIEFENGILQGFEIKYSQTGKFKIPAAFKTLYPDSVVNLINRDNYLEFIS